VQIGFLEHGRWYGSVCVTRPGLFKAAIEIQKAGRYGLIAANCVLSSWQERARAHPIRWTVGLLAGGYLPNRFRVTEAGWLKPAD